MLIRHEEEKEDAKWEEEIRRNNILKHTVDEERKKRIKEKRKWRAEKKKLDSISLLEFIRQVVDLIFKKHTDERNVPATSDILLTPATLTEVRYDSGQHLIKMTGRRGVCKECKQRTTFRCVRSNVALHANHCFYNFHTMEEDRD